LELKQNDETPVFVVGPRDRSERRAT
jgi:hypothetical protein